MADIRIIPAIGAINVTGSADFRGTGASSVLFVSGSGNVGIGTSTPSSKLHVAGAIKATALTGHMFGDGTDTTRAISILDSNLSQGSTRVITLGRSNSNNNQAEIGFYLDQTGSAANRLSLGLYNSSTTLNVLGSGGVGIGTVSGLTTAPNSAKLEVYDTVSRGAGGGTIRVTSTANSQTVLALKNTTSGKTWEMSVGGSNNTEVPGGFYIYEAGVTSRLVITGSNGNVGIGTVNPLGKLHVKGGGGNGTLYIEGTSYTSHFNYGTNEDTYIRPGKAAGHVIIADVGSNVGIGTAAPRSKLHVAGAGNTAGGNIIIGNHSDGEGKWSFITSTHYSSSQEPEGFSLIGGYTTATKNAVVIGGNIYESNPSTEIQFWTHTATTHSLGGTQKMNINSVGQVRFNTYGSATHTGTAAYRLAVDSSGNIIEESLGAGAVDGLGSSRYIARWEDADTLTSSSIYQDANGNIGIGTTAPATKLAIQTSNTAISVGQTAYNYSTKPIGLQIAGWDSTYTNAGGIKFHRWNGTADNYYTAYLGQLYNGSEFVLAFRTDSTSSLQDAQSTRMVIDTSGNVGIGITVPVYDLDVNGTGLFRDHLRIVDNKQLLMGSGDMFQIGHKATYSQIATYEGDLFIDNNANDYDIVFRSDDGSGGLAEYFRLDGSTTHAYFLNPGNVGIGLTNPSARLDVYQSGSTALNIAGSQGQLFSVTDDLSGSLMSVNDISGIPILEVFSDDRVVAGQFGSNTLVVNGTKVGIGTATPSYKLDVATGNDDALKVYNSLGGNNNGIALAVGSGTPWIDFHGSSFDIKYNTSPGSWNSGANRFVTILSGGNVGIGNTNPTAKLQVGVEAHGSATGIEVAAGAGGANLIALTDSTNHNWFPYTDGRNYYSAIEHIFRDSTHSTNWMYISGSGNIGMGTDTPVSPIQVYRNSDVWHARIGGGSGELRIGGQTSSGAVIQAYTPAGVVRDLYLQRDGGKVGIGTSGPVGILDVRGGRSYFSPAGDSSSGTSSHAIEVWNANDGVFTANALAAYNAHTSWDIGSKAAYTISPRPQNGSIYTHAGEGAATSVAIQRFVQFNSSNTAPLLDWTFFQWDGAGTAATDLKRPANLWTVKTYESAATSEKLSLSGDGDLTLAGDLTAVNGAFSGDMTVDGIITAKEFHTTFVSASIIYQSGSTQFGDTADDIHEFNGKIGINTGTPETALHVIGDIGAGTGYNGGFYATSNTTDVDQNWGFDFSKTTSVDDYATRIKFYPEAGSTRKMGFYDERSDAWLGYFDGSVNSNLNFIFSSGGRVGIGETAPSYPLHVIGKIYSTTEVQGGSAFMKDTGGISVFGSNTSTRSIRIGRDGVTSDIFISGSNGRVGIGTNYPYAPLHVYQGVGTNELSTFSNYTSGGRVQLGFQQNDTDGLHHRVYLRGEKDANGTYGGRFDLYVRQHSTANQLQALTVRSDGNVGIGSASPAAKLDVAGIIKTSGLNVDNGIVFNSKTMTMTNTFADALTVNMNAHTGCYVKITAFGDWGNHSSIAYLGEFFLQNGDGAYNEPGRIIRQVDNTYTDHIEAQIVDPASSGTRDFVIQLKATATASFTAYLQYEVRGLFNSVS